MGVSDVKSNALKSTFFGKMVKIFVFKNTVLSAGTVCNNKETW